MLVSQFISNPNWPREIKIAKKLLYLCPDIDAWKGLFLDRPISSLSFFLTDGGEIFIPHSKKNPYLLDLDKLQPKSKNSVDFNVG